MKALSFKRLFSAAVCFVFITNATTVSFAENAIETAIVVNHDIPAKSAILIEQSSGRVLYEKNADQKTAPASITKIMTMLLVMEAIDSGKLSFDTMITCSPHASSMGGTQIWFEPGEQMTVHELLKATAVASANDAAVALGEAVAGSEEAFAAMMNARAAELNMTNTNFVNATGLDADGHLTTARDIAIMGAELLKHEKIKEYTTIWMDELRGGETQLVNTNKLVRFYQGATGLKTGTTDDAGYCLCASAERNGLSLIAVVLGGDSSEHRFSAARSLLDYGFANFEMRPVPEPDVPIEPIAVTGGVKRKAAVIALAPKSMLTEKGQNKKLTQEITLSESLCAPVTAGQTVGSVLVMLDGVVICEYPLAAAETIDEMTFRASVDMTLSQLFRLM